MSSVALAPTFPLVASSREEAASPADARAYSFIVSRRADLSILSEFQRKSYEMLCREMPPEKRSPPALPLVDRGITDDWSEAVAACKSPDDQITALPKGWFYDGDKLDEEMTCRPMDKGDAKNFEKMKTRFGSATPRDNPEDVQAIIEEVKDLRQLTR